MLSASGSRIAAAVVAHHATRRPRPSMTPIGAWAWGTICRKRKAVVRYCSDAVVDVGTNGEEEEIDEEEDEEEGGAPAPPAWSKEVTDSNVVCVAIDTPMMDVPAAVWYVPDFLDETDARAVSQGCEKLRKKKKFKSDHSFAVGRLSAMVRGRQRERERERVGHKSRSSFSVCGGGGRFERISVRVRSVSS